MLASYTGLGGPVTVVIRRGDGYYGNSHIFRGGENLADPHLAGDEHHQYLAHAANGAAQKIHHDDHGEHDLHGANVRSAAKQKTLKTSTLAEEATLKEAKVARAKAKAEALARAQLLMDEDEGPDDVFEPVPDTNIVQEIAKPKDNDSPRRRPLMPLKKLADKVKADREARKKAQAEREEMEAEVEKQAMKSNMVTEERERSSRGSFADINEGENDDAELEGIIAKLRQEALDRRLRKIHAAQRDVKQSHQDDVQRRKADAEQIDDEARIRRPGIVKSRKVSTKED